MHWMYRLSAVGALATLAACSSTEPSNTASTSTDVTMDVATAATEMGAQDVEMMHGPGGSLGFGLHTDRGRFSCDSMSHGGLTVVRTCTYADSDGASQDAYDSSATATMTVHTEITGGFDRGWWNASMNRTSDLVVSGLAGANTTMIWNGSGSGSSSMGWARDSANARQYNMSFSGTITDVVIPVPRTDTSWPLSGTIAREVTVTYVGGPRDGTTVTRNTTLEFNGTQYATLTVNGKTFQVDLERRSCHRDDHDRDGHGHGHDDDHDDDKD